MNSKLFTKELHSILFLYRKSNIIKKDPNKIAKVVDDTLDMYTKTESLKREYRNFIIKELPKVRENPNMALVFESMKKKQIGNYLNSLMLMRKKSLQVQNKLSKSAAKNIYEYSSQYRKKRHITGLQRIALRDVIGLQVENDLTSDALLDKILMHITKKHTSISLIKPSPVHPKIHMKPKITLSPLKKENAKQLMSKRVSIRKLSPIMDFRNRKLALHKNTIPKLTSS